MNVVENFLFMLHHRGTLSTGLLTGNVCGKGV
jgi:hypothetical protein